MNNEKIQSVVGDSQALLVPHASIPGNISAPFVSAGAKFADDFDRYCRTLIFLPKLAIGDPHKEQEAAGFSLASLLDVPPELKTEYQEALFHCPVKDERELKADQTIHWELSNLIGQAKIWHLAFAQQLSLSETGLEAFALMYQRSMFRELIARDFGERDPLTDRNLYAGASGYLIRGLNAMIANCRTAKPEEVSLVERLEIGGTTDKP